MLCRGERSLLVGGESWLVDRGVESADCEMEEKVLLRGCVAALPAKTAPNKPLYSYEILTLKNVPPFVLLMLGLHTKGTRLFDALHCIAWMKANMRLVPPSSKPQSQRLVVLLKSNFCLCMNPTDENFSSFGIVFPPSCSIPNLKVEEFMFHSCLYAPESGVF